MGQDRSEEDNFYEILSAEQIVDHMVESIKEVNNVIQIPTTTVSLLYSVQCLSLSIILLSELGPDLVEPLQVGQGKADGKVLLGSARENVFRGQSHFALSETACQAPRHRGGPPRGRSAPDE